MGTTWNPQDDNSLAPDVYDETDVKRPKMYQVVLLNDDYTTMEFVIYVLQKFFHKTADEAYDIMMHVHKKGAGVCGVFPFDIAELKVMQVNDEAKAHQYPLRSIMEEIKND